MRFRPFFVGGPVLLLVAFLITGCDGLPRGEQDYPQSAPGGKIVRTSEKPPETVFGEGGLFDNKKGLRDGETGGGIGVNGFLWRASLDTISFMPLSSADPFGGVIITDWYTPPDSPGERFKLTVYILDRRLRADGLRVSAFKQNLDSTNNWIPVSVTPKTITNLENAILTRARQLRINLQGQ